MKKSKITSILSAALLMSFLGPAIAQAGLRVDIRQNAEIVMKDKVYLLINHAAELWDPQRTTEKTVHSYLSWAREKKITSIATVHGETYVMPELESWYFINNDNVDLIMHSDNGQHKLRFPKAKAIVVGGGNLSVCLCETLRDVVAGMSSSSEDREILLVKEMVYDFDFFGMPSTRARLLELIDQYFLPNFPCPVQTFTGFGPIDLSKFRIEFYENSELIRAQGATGSPAIRIRLLKDAAVRTMIDQILKGH
jgi:hypothetical protein